MIATRRIRPLIGWRPDAAPTLRLVADHKEIDVTDIAEAIRYRSITRNV